MNDKLNIDKTIREKLEGFSAPPPAHVWSNIQGQMAAQQRKRRMAYASWIAAAALVVFAFIAGWVLNERGAVLPETAQQEMEQVLEDVGKTIDKTPINESEDEGIFVAETDLDKTNSGNNNIESYVSKTSPSNKMNKENSFVASVERISYDLLESIEAIFTIEQENVYLAEDNNQPEEWTLSASDDLLIAENIRNSKNEKDVKNTWKIGTLISPGYASNSTKHSEQYAQEMNYSGDDGTANVGAGFAVHYKTSKRLRVESGVYYSQNGQSSNNSNSRMFASNGNADYLNASPEYGGNEKVGFSNSVALNSNGIAMNSAAGVINMNSAPKGAVVATNAEPGSARNSNTLTTSGQFSQVFQFVEIPLYLRYNVLDKRFGIEIMGGLNAGLVVGNNAYIDNEYGKQNIGSTEDISTMNLSGTVGLGLNYGLGKHFSLALEPRLNYYLNSINSNPDVDFRPYRVGIFTGVYYEF